MFLELLGEKKCSVKECIVFSMNFSQDKIDKSAIALQNIRITKILWRWQCNCRLYCLKK